MPTVRTLIGNIKGPKGDTGATGATGPQGPGATIEVGTVSTTAYGNPAQITNSGTETEAKFDFVIPQGKPGEQTTKMSLLTLDTITTQTTEYPVPAVGDVGSTAWGKIVKFFNDIKTAVTGKVDTTSIVNNLTSTSTDKPLSAAQGKALNDAIASLSTTIAKNHFYESYAASSNNRKIMFRELLAMAHNDGKIDVSKKNIAVGYLESTGTYASSLVGVFAISTTAIRFIMCDGSTIWGGTFIIADHTLPILTQYSGTAVN